MAALSSALDQIHNLQLGENNNPEYCWAEDEKELITQFHFQLTRTSNMENLKDKYDELLRKVFVPVLSGENTSTENIKYLYKLIGYTRDIVAGKGEYNLTYMLISRLYYFSRSNYCPDLVRFKIKAMATSALESLVKTNIHEHPYGSWKDLKYFCNYHISPYDRSEHRIRELNDPMINKVIELICGQLRCDEVAPVKTLLAKWIPREKSAKFGWITSILATEYYKSWINPEHSIDRQIAARKKCLTHFRQLVAKINKQLNTTQINQCNGTWSDIDFDKSVTSITLRKQSKAFQGTDKNGKPRTKIINNQDRMQCKYNHTDYINKCKNGETRAKGKRVSIVDFVRDAIQARKAKDTVDEDCINAQWIDNSSQNQALGDLIAMVDTSGSMEGENCTPLYSAIGLGIRIAEKSKLGKRIMTFSSNPTWVNLDDCNDFVSMVDKARDSPWGMNTNFAAALDLILNTAISNNISPVDMENMTLVILSDMQIDQAECKSYGYSYSYNSTSTSTSTSSRRGENLTTTDTMFEMMKNKYHDAGLRTKYNCPYKLPHIVFWNLRSTSGFPSLSQTENTSMMSGNSPVLLNAFCEHGIESLKEATPWNILVKQLSNKRYDYLENIVENLWPNMM